MYFIQFILVLLGGAVFTCQADEAADSKLREIFQKMDGPAGEKVTECLTENSLTLGDLKNYESADDVPENELCFYKCFYEKLGFIKDGNIIVDVPEGVLEPAKVEEIKKCVEGLGKVETCTDLRKAEKCTKGLL